MANIMVTDYLYIISYPTWNGYRIVNDPAYTAYFQPASNLVIGSDNSSNSRRLVEVANSLGTPAYLIDDETGIEPDWLAGRETVGITSGASAPEWLVERVVDWLKADGATEVEQLHTVDEPGPRP